MNGIGTHELGEKEIVAKQATQHGAEMSIPKHPMLSNKCGSKRASGLLPIFAP